MFCSPTWQCHWRKLCSDGGWVAIPLYVWHFCSVGWRKKHTDYSLSMSSEWRGILAHPKWMQLKPQWELLCYSITRPDRAVLLCSCLLADDMPLFSTLNAAGAGSCSGTIMNHLISRTNTELFFRVFIKKVIQTACNWLENYVGLVHFWGCAAWKRQDHAASVLQMLSFLPNVEGEHQTDKQTDTRHNITPDHHHFVRDLFGLMWIFKVIWTLAGATATPRDTTTLRSPSCFFPSTMKTTIAHDTDY